MSFSALIYTAAAVAFFALMVMRAPVDPTQSTSTTTTAPVAQTDADTNQAASTEANTTDGTQTGQATSTEANTTDGTQTNQAASTEAKTADEAQASNTEEADSVTDDTTAPASTEKTDTADSATKENTTSSASPDYARERRIGNQISDAILDGEVLYLHDGSRNFMSIQTDADDAKGGAIILHGRGFHADWEDTINPLRIGLVDAGWTTLSLQMPVLDKQAKYYDYVPLFPEAGQRIKAGIQHLKDQGINKVAIIAHSCGGHMAMHWLGEQGDTDIAAFVGLGLGATDFKQKMEKPFPLDKLTVPVFDAYGENEFPAVIKMAPERWELIKAAGNPQSEQRVLTGADHYFKDKGDEITEMVATWLNGLKF